jgi:hypothetical protein
MTTDARSPSREVITVQWHRDRATLVHRDGTRTTVVASIEVAQQLAQEAGLNAAVSRADGILWTNMTDANPGEYL